MIVKTNQYELKGQLQDLSDTEKYLKIIDDRNKEIERQKNAGKPAEERTIDNEEKSIYANRQTAIKVNMDYFRKRGMLDGDRVYDGDLGDGVVGDVKIVDNAMDSAANSESNNKETSKSDTEVSSPKDYRTSSAGRAGKPPVINTKEGKELTDGIHKMWQSITGNRNN